jgi:L-asparaginase
VTKINQKIVVLGTGGTIAGTANSSADHTGYTAAQIGVAQLLMAIKGLPEALQGCELVTEQVAQIDSKDMDFVIMARLSSRCAHWLGQTDVVAVLVTHGTDTLEETAWFLHLTLPAALQTAKPVVLTCAMRPATSSEADGPRNVLDAVRLAQAPLARGVLVVCAGDVHHAAHVQKVHSHALNAFSSGAHALAAQVQGDRVNWTSSENHFSKKNEHFSDVDIGKFAINSIVNDMPWPRVEVLLNHTHNDASLMRALLAQRSASLDCSSTSTDADSATLKGIVVAATGNGTLAHDLQAALCDAQQQGVVVLRSTRCVWGSVTSVVGDVLDSTPLSPLKARIALVLQLRQKDI